MSTEQDSAAPASAPPAPRVVVGLGSVAPTAAKAKRSRNKAKAGNKETVNGEVPASTATTADAAAPSAAPAAGHHPTLNLESVPLEPLPELQRTPASAIVSKRVKQATKKIQRIQGYQDQTESLNPDQQRAVASKPGLEATVKELQEIVKVLEADEAELAKVTQERSVESEKRVHARIAVAVAEAKKHTQQELTLLLQFFHLRSLFMPGQGINPPTLPPVVANATGQEGAAVMTLAEALENGPLLGGHDDAFERIQKLQRGDETSTVHADITYGRIKQMILDLTAPPAELGTDSVQNDDLGPTVSSGSTQAHANGAAYPELTAEGLRPDEEQAASEAHANLAAGNGPALTFMQDSELDDLSAAPPAQTELPVEWQATPAAEAKPTTGTWDDVPASIGNWADEVDEATATDRQAVEPPAIQPLEDAAPAPVDISAVVQETAPAGATEGAPLQNGNPSAGRGRGGPRRGRGGALPPVSGSGNENASAGWVSPAYRGKNPRPRGPNYPRNNSNAPHHSSNASAPVQEPLEDGWNRVEKKHGDDAGRGRSSRGRGGRGRGDRGRGGVPRTNEGQAQAQAVPQA